MKVSLLRTQRISYVATHRLDVVPTTRCVCHRMGSCFPSVTTHMVWETFISLGCISYISFQANLVLGVCLLSLHPYLRFARYNSRKSDLFHVVTRTLWPSRRGVMCMRGVGIKVRKKKHLVKRKDFAASCQLAHILRWTMWSFSFAGRRQMHSSSHSDPIPHGHWLHCLSSLCSLRPLPLPHHLTYVGTVCASFGWYLFLRLKREII